MLAIILTSRRVEQGICIVLYIAGKGKQLDTKRVITTLAGNIDRRR
jgi:hypothetical protein